MMYKDKRGWRFTVMCNRRGAWKACYNKPDRNIWMSVDALSWRDTREEAESDLAEYAARHDMQVVEE